MNHVTGWIVFHVIVFGMLIIDLGVFNKKPHKIGVKEAAINVAVWFGVAFLFNIGIYFYNGEQQALEFFTGYIIEKSLSIDNIFVMIMIFSTFHIPDEYQHKILYWGILGAILMRGAMILLGVAIVERFHWVFYIFGVFLIYSSIKMILKKDGEHIEVEKNFFVRLVKKIYPVTQEYQDGRFFVKINGVKHVTTLFLTLIVIEFTDLVFAIDSIPAIFAITTDPFIVYTSNIFAILGLRSMYFALASVIEIFYLLKYGLGIVLGYVGVKMLLIDFYHMPTLISLIIIVGVLSISIFLSVIMPKEKK
ncbi:MAG: TerC family protein [Calditerrivibrio sp.]|nr:TerC family protein [Calditerrivibrio sp.]MCA1933701.1 TerC family protein [Calditerrivibrio sp.]MCA1981056.1 TerC family protein [Calditerrivibrio sp.]